MVSRKAIVRPGRVRLVSVMLGLLVVVVPVVVGWTRWVVEQGQSRATATLLLRGISGPV